MVEPLSVVYHAVKKSNFKSGDTALIIGAGPVCAHLLSSIRVLNATLVVAAK